MSETDFDGRESPTRILPEKSILDLETYLDMQSALADETLFRVLYALKHVGEADPESLGNTLDLDADRVESSLEELVDVGLVECRMRKTPEMDDGEIYIYYRASALGEGLLEEGIEELLDGEWKSLERYS